MDYGRTRVDPNQWTRQSFGEFKEVIRRLEGLDKKLDQPHCEDARKTEWMEDIERRLAELETA